MWICFNDGFVSAVKCNDSNMLKIRSRRKEHLEKHFPEKEIHVDVGTDYKYRVFATKEEFAKIVSDSIMNTKYTNFKNSVNDHDLHDLYADFWHLHYRYQR
jgi:hypothetical protein